MDLIACIHINVCGVQNPHTKYSTEYTNIESTHTHTTHAVLKRNTVNNNESRSGGVREVKKIIFQFVCGTVCVCMTDDHGYDYGYGSAIVFDSVLVYVYMYYCCCFRCCCLCTYFDSVLGVRLQQCLCANILWKNDKLFKVPNAINQDCFRCYCFVCIARDVMVLIMFESRTVQILTNAAHTHTMHTHSDSKSIALVTETPHHFTINLQADYSSSSSTSITPMLKWPHANEPIYQTKTNSIQCALFCTVIVCHCTIVETVIRGAVVFFCFCFFRGFYVVWVMLCATPTFPIPKSYH